MYIKKLHFPEELYIFSSFFCSYFHSAVRLTICEEYNSSSERQTSFCIIVLLSDQCKVHYSKTIGNLSSFQKHMNFQSTSI
uniref:Putative ovule protein n=1 Tax=Solanum chacoense TaxID=4108 RepID=A0A0V0H2H1_SOLCH